MQTSTRHRMVHDKKNTPDICLPLLVLPRNQQHHRTNPDQGLHIKPKIKINN